LIAVAGARLKDARDSTQQKLFWTKKGKTMGFEIAFRVKHDSLFYKQYFEAKDEREKLRKFERPFFEKYGIDGRFYQCKTLGVELTREQREKFADQVRKNPDRKGFYCFKLKSAIEKEWEKTVTNHIDFDRLGLVDLWWFGVISQGIYNLWDADGEIYGYLATEQTKNFEPEGFMEEIKLSEYYAVMERLKNNG
jgi:hypothetical protein